MHSSAGQEATGLAAAPPGRQPRRRWPNPICVEERSRSLRALGTRPGWRELHPRNLTVGAVWPRRANLRRRWAAGHRRVEHPGDVRELCEGVDELRLSSFDRSGVGSLVNFVPRLTVAVPWRSRPRASGCREGYPLTSRPVCPPWLDRRGAELTRGQRYRLCAPDVPPRNAEFVTSHKVNTQRGWSRS